MSKRTIKRVVRQCLDPFIRLALSLDDFQQLLLEPAGLREAEQVLDVGCGTGALVVLIKRLHPHTNVWGFDRDADALDIAKVKAARAGVIVTFQQGTSSELPFPDASLDQVFSIFMFHELDGQQKQQTFREIIRVLRPGGALHIADFGRPQNWLMRLALVWIRLSHRLSTISDNVSGALPQFVRAAGFDVALDIFEPSGAGISCGTVPGFRPCHTQTVPNTLAKRAVSSTWSKANSANELWERATDVVGNGRETMRKAYPNERQSHWPILRAAKVRDVQRATGPKYTDNFPQGLLFLLPVQFMKHEDGENMVEAGVGKRKFGTRPLLEGDNDAGACGCDFCDVQSVRVPVGTKHISMDAVVW